MICDHPQTLLVTGCRDCPFFRHDPGGDPGAIFSCGAAARPMYRDPRADPPVWCPLANDVVLIRLAREGE